MCYTICADKRGCDHLPLKLSLKVADLSPMVSFPIGPSRRACPTHFISFLWCRVGGAPDYSKGFHGDFLSDDGESPVTAWREHIHAGKAVGRLTARTDEQLILSIGITGVRRSLKPEALGRHQHRQPFIPFHFPFFSLMTAASEGGSTHLLISLFRWLQSRSSRARGKNSIFDL